MLRAEGSRTDPLPLVNLRLNSIAPTQIRGVNRINVSIPIME